MTRRVDRDPTSDVELDASIAAVSTTVGLRYAHCRDAGYSGAYDGAWMDRVAAHVVIAALAREVEGLSAAVDRERRARVAAETAVRALERGAHMVIDRAAALAVGEQLELL